MTLSSRSISRRHSPAYTLAEIMVSVFVLAVMLTSLYAGFSSGFAIVKLSQENLRATQIMVQKLEDVRIYTWSQVTNTTFLRTNFTDYYNPSGTNNSTTGATYSGSVLVANADASIPADYRNRMKAITITLFWTNFLQKPNTNVIVRSRQMQTQVARYGMQDYIYK
jgi:hypothetical protein